MTEEYIKEKFQTALELFNAALSLATDNQIEAEITIQDITDMACHVQRQRISVRLTKHIGEL